MKMVFVKTIRKTILIVAFLSILTLMLNLFLPTISITESQDEGHIQYFNYQSMTSSNNTDVLQLYRDLGFINIILWIVIIISVFSFFGLIVLMSEHYKKIGNAILIIGCSSFIFSLLSLIFYFLLVKSVIDMDNISLANIFEPFRYVYIQMALLIFLVVASMANFIVVILPYIKKPKSKENEVKGKVKVEGRRDFGKDYREFRLKNKQIEWNDSAKKEEKSKEETKQPEKIEKIEEVEFESETTKEEKPVVTPFEKEAESEKKSEEVEDDSEDMQKSFENALNSAIGKKQLEKKGEKIEEKKPPAEQPEVPEKQVEEPPKAEENPVEQPPERKPTEEAEEQKLEESETKEFNVKCPQCNKVFSAKKAEGLTKIKCPHCGKEGIIK